MSSAGDVVHGLPVLCALRKHYPDAFIAWLVEDWAAELLHTHPALDQVILIHPTERVYARPPYLYKWWKLRARLRKFAFDTVFDIQGLSRSALAAWLTGAPRRIGFDGVDARQRSRWFNNVRVEPVNAHVVDRNLELLRALGITNPEVSFGLPPYPDQDASFAEWCVRAGIRGPFALMAIGSSKAAKQWSPNRYGQTAAALRDRYEISSLVLWGTRSEKAAADEVVAQSDEAAIVLPSTNLRDVAAIARRANLVVGPDSVAIHVAAAVGATCVGLYGPTSSVRNGPYGMVRSAVQSVDGTTKAIPVGDVVRMLDSALKATGSRSTPGRTEGYR